VEHHRAPEVEPIAGASHALACARAELFDKQSLDILRANPARRELVAIADLRQKRLAPQALRGVFDGVFERQMLEGVQRVVVNEDADRALRRSRCAISSITRVKG
jgi:hypothetical protein